MENSRIGMIITALPLLILVSCLVFALYDTGFDVEAAALPENPAAPLNETLTSLLEMDRPLVTSGPVESVAGSGTVTLTGSVENPTAHPLTVQRLEFRVPGDDGGVTASMTGPVEVSAGEKATVLLTGTASPDAVVALKSGSVEGVLLSEIQIMGIRITTEVPGTWRVGA